MDPAPATSRPESYRESVLRLAAEQGVRPLGGPADLRGGIWDSDDELAEFLHDVRRSRNSDLS